MKKFEEAELEVMTFESNVIATSGGTNTCPTAQLIECINDCPTKCDRNINLCPTKGTCFIGG